MPPTLFGKLQELNLCCLDDTLLVNVLHETPVQMDILTYKVGTLRVYHSVITVARHKEPHLGRRYLAGRRFRFAASRITGVFYLKWVRIIGTPQS